MSADKTQMLKKTARAQDCDENILNNTEPMDTEVVDFNSNMRTADQLCPTILQKPIIQDMDAPKDFPSLDVPVSEGVGTEEIADDDPSVPSGILEFLFRGIEDPRKTEIKPDFRLLSTAKRIRCLPWKILLVFSRPESRTSMGMFLQCNAESPSTTWTCHADAKLEIVSQNKRAANKTQKIHHMFASKENDWGYQAFINYAELFNPDNGYVVNNTILARITVDADPPHGAEWDSKKYTGFVGLKNQGATCYLNSVLQALYCTNRLRRAVFRMPTESDDSQTSVPLALQRTFYELQCSNQAVGTEKLTRSFGWATWDSFMQHDAQELCRVLLDNIENKMKGTAVEEIIPSLFCGKMASYIRCTNVDYESRREESFYDIQLKVKGNKDVHAAFKEYVQMETLTNDNKYDAGEHGLQDAVKGVKFVKFPPVLYLQLMRFQYDFHTNANVKINDRFEFPYELDLEDYLHNPNEAHNTKYFLHAVLVHSGDHHGGHYVVYINPSGNNVWYQFDDDVVSRCSPRDAIEMNYGSNETNDGRSFTNAYMLVYISEAAKEEVLCPVTDKDLPPSLHSRFLEEQSIDEKKRKEKDSAHEFSTIYLLLEEDFYGYEGPEVFRFDLLPMRSVRVKRDSDELKLINSIADVLQWAPETIRLWKVSQREKGSYQIEFSQPGISDLSRESTLIFWAQRLLVTSPLSVFDPSSPLPATSRLLFFKYFDPCSCSLSFCGHFEFTPNLLTTCSSVLRERACLVPDTPLIFFAELNSRRIFQVDLGALITPGRQVIQGEVIFFQVDPRCRVIQSVTAPEETGKDAMCLLSSSPGSSLDNSLDENKPRIVPGPLECSNLRKLSIKPLVSTSQVENLPSFLDYHNFRLNQVEILLVDKLRKLDPGILIRMSRNLNYTAFANLVAGYLSARPDRIQFFAAQPMSALNIQQGQQGLLSTIGANDNANSLASVNLFASGGSPVANSENTAGNGNYSPNSQGFNLISVQSAAARASGFSGISPQIISTIASVAYQGLLREPPGPPIPSTVTVPLCDFLQLPVTTYPIQSQLSTATNLAFPGSATQDRLPQLVSRYSGFTNVISSPFGNLSVPAARRVYYAHIALPINQLESLKQVQVSFIGPRLSDRLDLSLSVPSNGTVADLLAEARPHVVLACSRRLRLMEVRNNRIITIYTDDYPLEKIEQSLNTRLLDSNDNLQRGLRIEELPADEVTPQLNDMIIFAAHFNKDLNDTFGVPFTVRIRDQEQYSEVKERIRKRLDVLENEFGAWNFVLVTKTKPICIPNEADVLVDTKVFAASNTMTRPWLGVEHKPFKRPRYATSEKPIKIHN